MRTIKVFVGTSTVSRILNIGAEKPNEVKGKKDEETGKLISGLYFIKQKVLQLAKFLLLTEV